MLTYTTFLLALQLRPLLREPKEAKAIRLHTPDCRNTMTIDDYFLVGVQGRQSATGALQAEPREEFIVIMHDCRICLFMKIEIEVLTTAAIVILFRKSH